MYIIFYRMILVYRTNLQSLQFLTDCFHFVFMYLVVSFEKCQHNNNFNTHSLLFNQLFRLCTREEIIIYVIFIIVLFFVTAAKAHVIDIVDHQWDEGQRFRWPRRQRRSGRGSRHSIGQHTFRLSPLHRRTHRVGVQGTYIILVTF